MTKTKKNQGKKQKESDYIGTTKTKDKENAEKPLKIDDTPLNVARILMTTPPPNESEWQYLKDAPSSSTYGRQAG